ncbi:hypothetical protein PV325_002753 [Microctonus aethiopoides]|nr:hypothetical protein PV325_002753 [Microctonus aethiopoides]
MEVKFSEVLKGIALSLPYLGHWMLSQENHPDTSPETKSIWSKLDGSSFRAISDTAALSSCCDWGECPQSGRTSELDRS